MIFLVLTEDGAMEHHDTRWQEMLFEEANSNNNNNVGDKSAKRKLDKDEGPSAKK